MYIVTKINRHFKFIKAINRLKEWKKYENHVKTELDAKNKPPLAYTFTLMIIQDMIAHQVFLSLTGNHHTYLNHKRRMNNSKKVVLRETLATIVNVSSNTLIKELEETLANNNSLVQILHEKELGY